MTDQSIEKTTVEEAISRGHRIITYPVTFIMFATAAMIFYLGIRQDASWWIWALGIPLSLVFLPWFYWSIRITKWKVWAFENVRNVHELKKRAIQEKLIRADDSIFNKTEIWSRPDKERWRSLQPKFQQRDKFVFLSDPTVPQETIIYYSKAKIYFGMAFLLSFLAIGICLIIMEDYIWGVILSVIGTYFTIKESGKIKNVNPQIMINEEGIQTASAKFYTWESVNNEDIEIQGAGRYGQHFLTFKHSNGSERLAIDDYNISAKQLRRLLKIYRGRHFKKSLVGYYNKNRTTGQ